MVFYSPLDLDKELMKYQKALGLDFGGKKYDVIFDMISKSCPHIKSDEELYSLAVSNLEKIRLEYGMRGLRVWYHSAKKNLMLKDLCRDEDGWGGDDLIERKYFKLIPNIWEFHNKLMFKSDYFLNYMRYFRLLEKAYSDEYGNLFERIWVTDEPDDLYHLLKAIHLSYYDECVIKSLLPAIEDHLHYNKCKYYLSLDLTDPEVLGDIYLHLAEESWDSDAFRGFDMFYSNDGWGNVIFDRWDTTHNPDGSTTSKLIRPETNRDSFKNVGNVWL